MSNTLNRLYDRFRTQTAVGPERDPMHGENSAETADEGAIPLQGVEERSDKLVTPSGFTGPRGRTPDGTPVSIPSGLPMAQAGEPSWKRPPKGLTLPRTPYQMTRVVDVPTLANSGRLLDRDAGHPIHGMQVDNYSRLWLYIPSAARYIPPYTGAIQFQVFGAPNKLEVLASAPPVFTQAAANASEVFCLTAYEHELDYSSGIDLPGAPTGGGAATTISAPVIADADNMANFTGVEEVAHIYGYRADTNLWNRLAVIAGQGDANGGGQALAVANLLYNGATFDRLRAGQLTGSLLHSAVPSAATPTEASATGTNASTAATVAAAVGKTSYILGFTITAQAGTALGGGVATVTGITNTLSYQVESATGSGFILNVLFPFPIPATATNTAVTVTVPALGATTGAVAVSVYGFQL